MLCTRLAPLLLLVTVAACGAASPSFQETGTLANGAAIIASVRSGSISLYAPQRGQPLNGYAVEAFGGAAAPAVTHKAHAVIIVTTAANQNVLLRASPGTTARLTAFDGNINAADYDGIVNAQTGRGDIKMLLPRYGSAQAGTGNVSVIFAATSWPGTLHFSSQKGDVELYVNETAVAHVHLYTKHGTIFTDFPLKGTARGSSELIDGFINPPAQTREVSKIDVYVRDGSIRLLQLKPQV